MAFWLAIDKLDLKMVQNLSALDLHLRYLLLMALKRKPELSNKLRGKLQKKKNKVMQEESGSGQPLVQDLDGRVTESSQSV
jgi:hypothetical protein